MLYGFFDRLQVVLTILVLIGTVKATAVTLVENGKPAAVIITAEEPTIAANLAALELQYHIEVITGAVLPIKAIGSAEKSAGVQIFVGESDATRKLGLKSANFKSQEYLIKVDDNTVILMGRDWLGTPANRAEVGRGIADSLSQTRKKINYSTAIGKDKAENQIIIELPGLMDEQGTCYAAYDFLERFCGVRWYGPAMFNMVIPSQKTLTVQPISIRRTPSLLHRYAPGGGWPILSKQWGRHLDSQKDLFLRRIRYGGERWGCNHSLSGYYNRFLNKESKLFERYEPSFFAVGYENEAPRCQLCYTNPELIKQVAQDARDFFDGKGINGQFQVAVGDYFAIVPEDSDHWCKCEKCQAILEKSKSQGSGYFGTGLESDYIFGFINEVAKEVKKTNPNKYIAALAYAGYSYLPTFEVESNVAVAPCLLTCDAYGGGFKNDKMFYNEWVEESRHSGRPLYLWNYFHWPYEVAILGGWKCFPSFMPDVISDWVKRYARDGIRGFYLCGVPQNQLDYCLYMQTAFDAYTDYMKFSDDFFTRYFGAAAEPMKKFYWRISDINRQERTMGSSEEASWKTLGTKERMAELGALMDEAVKLASTDLEKQRVESWRKGIWEYMQKGKQDYLFRKTKESLLSQLQPVRLRVERNAHKLPEHFEFTLTNPFDLTVTGELVWQIPEGSPWHFAENTIAIGLKPQEQQTITIKSPAGAHLNHRTTYEPLPKLDLKLKAAGEPLFNQVQAGIVFDYWPYVSNRKKAQDSFNLRNAKPIGVVPGSESSLILKFQNPLEWSVQEHLSWNLSEHCQWNVQPQSKTIELDPGQTEEVEFKVSFSGTIKEVYPLARLDRRVFSDNVEIVKKSYQLPFLLSPEIEQALREQTRSVTSPYTEGIIVDGKLDEPQWQHCPVATNLTLLGGKQGWADNQSQARFAYDRKHLYVSFKCDEADLSKLVTRTENHDGNVWNDDCIELYLDTDVDKRPYYLMTINANGVIFDSVFEGQAWNPVPWDSDATVKAGRVKDAWVLEIAIPWEKLGVDNAQNGTTLGMNFCRHQPNKIAEQQEPWSQWSVTFQKSNHVPNRFGRLILDQNHIRGK